jgi:NitT/TauT family transport system substrate-binding protein
LQLQGREDISMLECADESMAGGMSRRRFIGLAATISAVAAYGTGLVGCSSSDTTDDSSSAVPAIIIGTMPTEDLLPFFVADDQSLLVSDVLNASIQVFQSAQELSVAITSGDVQFAMTDPMVAASLFAAGTDITMEWVTLGADSSQGRFGVQTSASSGYTSLSDLADVPVGVGSNTVPEYVFDVLMHRAGIADDRIVSEEIKKLPVRFQMMQSNQVAAAALPGSMLALGEATGCITLADDSSGENISQSVMVGNTTFVSTTAGDAALKALEGVWNTCVGMVNDDPDAYRDILVAGASLPDAVASTYPIATYPEVVKPSADVVGPILDWMQGKGYLTTPLSYDESTGTFSKG